MENENMDEDQILLLINIEVEKLRLFLALQEIKKKYKKMRSCGVRKMLKERAKKGYYSTLIPRLRISDEETFRNFHRMSPTVFDELLSILGPSFRQRPRRSAEEITPGERLAVTIRYLASGDSMKSIGFYGFRMGASTTSNIIRETCQLIWEKLQFVFPTPCEEMWQQIASEFYTKWGFPNCLGAIDGKHVVIQAFPKHNSLTFNYKHTHSLLLMAIADANYKFVMVDIGALGHNSDGSVFKTSAFGKSILNNPEQLGIPNEKELPITNEVVPFVFVADEAFPLRKNIMRPYSGRNVSQLPAEENLFNSQLSRSRRVVENAFGILSNRFRIFRKPIIASKETAANIIKSTVCLHNWLREKSPDLFSEGAMENEQQQNMLQISSLRQNHASADAVNIRKKFTNYFASRN